MHKIKNKKKSEINKKNPRFPDGVKVHEVKEDHFHMAKAKEIARLSNEQQQPVGVVIVHKEEILVSAHNNNPLTSLRLIKLHKKFCVRHFLGIPTGKHYWLCPGCASKDNHAEHKAVTHLLKQGIKDIEVDVYMWGHWACCDQCRSSLSKIKVENIYLLENNEKLFNPKFPENIIGRQFKLE